MTRLILILCLLLLTASVEAKLPQAAGYTDQIIIKLKGNEHGQPRGVLMDKDMLAVLSQKVGVELQFFRRMSLGADVLRLPQRLALGEVEQLTQKLQTLEMVDTAQPDLRMFHQLIPDDSIYFNDGTDWGQWAFYPPTNGYSASGVNAEAAWDTSTGTSNTVIVAVLDTGILPHDSFTDTTWADSIYNSSGRFQAGIDLISDERIANDGDGIDTDPTDAGDFITAIENETPGAFFFQCGESTSSWHGSYVASLIAATGNDGIGMAGMSWGATLVPVRVLGKCGGSESDIIDGILWASGESITGVSDIPTPADIQNLSLGSSSSCSALMQAAIDTARGNDSLMVIAAGNEASDVSNSSPANCDNVVSVAALSSGGRLATYSNFGSGITLSAPGGDVSSDAGGTGCSDIGSYEQIEDVTCMLGATNSSETNPLVDEYNYYSYSIGTSFAAPMVSGVAALMLDVNNELSEEDLRSLMEDGSVVIDFPSLPVTSSSTCSTSNCGVGMINAEKALSAAADFTADDSDDSSSDDSSSEEPTETNNTPSPSAVDGGGSGSLGMILLGMSIVSLYRRRQQITAPRQFCR